jgi:hypothetical protein
MITSYTRYKQKTKNDYCSEYQIEQIAEKKRDKAVLLMLQFLFSQFLFLFFMFLVVIFKQNLIVNKIFFICFHFVFRSILSIDKAIEFFVYGYVLIMVLSGIILVINEIKIDRWAHKEKMDFFLYRIINRKFYE